MDTQVQLCPLLSQVQHGETNGWGDACFWAATSEWRPNKQAAAELNGREVYREHLSSGGRWAQTLALCSQLGCKMGQFLPAPLQRSFCASIPLCLAGAGCCPQSLNPKPRGSEAAVALWTSCLSQKDMFRLVRGLWEIQLGDFSPELRLCPEQLGERVRSCPAGSHYTNPKTGRFKSGDATQYSVLFVCL